MAVQAAEQHRRPERIDARAHVPRREVEDGVDGLQGPVHRNRVTDVTLDQLHLRREMVGTGAVLPVNGRRRESSARTR
jgi:hypothetical protein